MGKFDNLDREQLLALLAESEQQLKKPADSESEQLLQDLRMHQVELEMQNRELRDSQQALEETRDRYAELYDFAPVGYLSINRNGTIQNINLTGARMLGKERSRLIDKPLIAEIESGDTRAISDHVQHAFSSAETVVDEFIFLGKETCSPRDIRFDSTVRTDSNADAHCFTIMTDVTERCVAERKVLAEQEFLQKIIDGVAEPVVVIDPDYNIRRLNRVALKTAESMNLDIQNLHCYELLHGNKEPCNDELQPCPLKTVQRTHQPCKVLHEHRTTGHEKRKFEVMATPLFDQDNALTYIVESAHDVTEHLELLDELKQRELSYAHLAQHDPLTSLPNRLLFADRLVQAMHVAHRKRENLAVLFIDLDQFKQLNDSFGHAFGDKVLKVMSERLSQLFREDDTVARMGGDEFTVILTNIKKAENVAMIANKIIQVLNAPFKIEEQTVYLGASIGVSIYPEHGTSVDELVRNADTAMYRAKDRGRGTFEYYSKELTDKAFQRVLLETSLHDAVEQNELVLFYQPQFDLNTKRLSGIEALVRWMRNGLGPVPPSTFIPLAEETGIILPMGDWILEQACRQMKKWLDVGVVTSDVTMSVNISGKQLDNPDLLGKIEHILDKHSLAPQNLELEVTESIMMSSTSATARLLTRFRELGIHIAIDDFGTGYSSLNYLKRLPLTRLKIDQSFVSDVPNNRHDVAIARTIIALAQNLSLDVLAEGVETSEQLAFLEAEGCNSAQGFLFSYPLPANEFEANVGHFGSPH